MCETGKADHNIDSEQFDAKKGATWHCIVGRNFGSFVTHGMLHDIYMPAHSTYTLHRDEALHLFLSRTCRDPAIQDTIKRYKHDRERPLNGHSSGMLKEYREYIKLCPLRK
jgi:hypothetical protein